MSEIRGWLEMTKQNGMSLDLRNTFSIIKMLNLDFRTKKIIHVAGSNGKGTACALMAASLTLSGHSNLMFSSPHVSRVEERIRINCKPISEEEFDNALIEIHHLSTNRNNVNNINLTFFEVTFLVSLVCAFNSEVEVIILETGLGGRFDATRCVPADVCLLTSITREHTDILGDNIADIAAEKAAIARPNKPIIIREMYDSKFREAVTSEIQNAGNITLNEQKIPANAKFIAIPENTSTREEALILVDEVLLSVDLPNEKLKEADNQLIWPARLQQFSHNLNSYLLDAAHNPSGLTRILPELLHLIKSSAPTVDGKIKWTLIFGTSPQNDLDSMIDIILELCSAVAPSKIYLTKPHGGRYPGVELDILSDYNWPTESISKFEEVDSVLQFIESNDPLENGLIVSLGSLYLQGNILRYLEMDSDEHLSLLPKQS
tara:strand:+ start:11545 stop:12843 length:1299 start_codon:yes stop_codon:yes gene_type:complete